MVKILISSAGRRVGLIKCFREAAAELGINCEIVAIDMEPAWSPACQVANYHYKVPRCTDSSFISNVIEICYKHRVEIIIPTIDNELLIYAMNKEIFNDEGTYIHISDEEFIKVVRNKLQTFRILKSRGIPVPETWTVNEIFKGSFTSNFPLIMKPIDGSCSQGIEVVHSRDYLSQRNIKNDRYILQKICSGKEFTVNCFYTKDNKCVSCIPHFRRFVRAGEVCMAETVRVPRFRAIADQLSTIFNGIRGCICFQGFVNKQNETSIFEINGRFGGGYPICDKAGGKYAKWIIQEVKGLEPDYNDNWLEGIRMLRYDDAIFTKKVG